MKYIISRFNHDLEWLKDYTDDYIIYDRSFEPLKESIVVPNIGSDIYDKFTFIIDNYNNLPDVGVYTKANLFKYITREEFDQVKDNKTFTPLLTKNHQEKMVDFSTTNPLKVFPPMLKFLTLPQPIKYSFYENGIYNELNTYGFINTLPCKSLETLVEVAALVGIWGKDYVQFAPGSNYIVPKENILKQPKELYELLRSYLTWTTYPGEAQIIERGLYNLWS